MDATIIECAFRLQKALDSNHPFSPCIDNTAKKLIALITSNNKAPASTKEESPIPDDALTFQSLLKDLDALVNALYTGASKSASHGADVDAIRALLQEQINKYRDEMRTAEERVAAHEKGVRALCKELLAASGITQMEAVRELIKASEATQRESILGLGVRVNAFEAIGLKGLRKDMDDKLGSWQTALEHQHEAHTTEVNALREKYDNQIKQFSEQINENTIAIGDCIYAGDKKSKKQQEELESRIKALESNWKVQTNEANAAVEALTKQVKELETKCEVLANNASYDDFEKLASLVEKEQPALPFEASDATAIMNHLKQLELNQNASINTHLELALTSTQMQLDNMRADMEKMDERLVVQETEIQFELTEDMVRDQHIKAMLNNEINRWVGEKILIGEDGCIDVAREVVQDEVGKVVRQVAQDEAEKAIKYAIKSGRVMSKLAPSGPPGTLTNARLLHGPHPGHLAPFLSSITNGTAHGPGFIEHPPFNDTPSPNAAPVTNGTPTGSSVRLPPHLTLGRPSINPTAPTFTPLTY